VSIVVEPYASVTDLPCFRCQNMHMETLSVIFIVHLLLCWRSLRSICRCKTHPWRDGITIYLLRSSNAIVNSGGNPTGQKILPTFFLPQLILCWTFWPHLQVGKRHPCVVGHMYTRRSNLPSYRSCVGRSTVSNSYLLFVPYSGRTDEQYSISMRRFTHGNTPIILPTGILDSAGVMWLLKRRPFRALSRMLS
jgi:hypothetical protein